MKNFKKLLILFLSWQMMVSPVMAQAPAKKDAPKVAPRQLFLHLLKKVLTDAPENVNTTRLKFLSMGKPAS